jgi:hypothetical protein
MSISCDPQSLVSNASCFSCITGDPKEWVKLYLLRHIAGLDAMTPQDLLAASACMTCVPPGMFKAVETYLLCQIANRGSGTSDVTWTPTSVDFFKVLVFGSNALATLPGITSITYTPTTSGGFQFGKLDDLTSFSAPNLVTVTDSFQFDNAPKLTNLSCPVLASIGADLSVSTDNLLTAVSFPALTVVPGSFAIQTSAALTSISLPALTSIGADVFCGASPLLTSVDLPNVIFQEPGIVTFFNCGLNAASINQILARCVASPIFASGGISVTLGGGTNAAPTGQGNLDKATLIAAGNTVTTN